MERYGTRAPVLIVSTGRCGTTTLTELLQLHPEVCCLNEATPPLRPVGFMKWSRHYPAKLIRNKIVERREKLIRQIMANGLVYIEGTPPASHLIREFYELFDFKFIHLYCDGRQFMRRAIDRGWHKKRPLPVRLWAFFRRRFLMRFFDGGRMDRWLIPPSELKTQFEKVAWLWTEVNGIIMQSMKALPEGQSFSMRLEDMDKEMLVELHKFIGISVYPDILKAMLEILGKKLELSQEPAFPSYEKWTDDERNRFDKIAGEMMKQLGYS